MVKGIRHAQEPRPHNKTFRARSMKLPSSMVMLCIHPSLPNKHTPGSSHQSAQRVRKQIQCKYCISLTCFRLASSWSMIPAEVVRMIFPKDRAGRSKFIQVSTVLIDQSCSRETKERSSLLSTETLKRGEMTPVLLSRPLSWMTTFPPR